MKKPVFWPPVSLCSERKTQKRAILGVFGPKRVELYIFGASRPKRRCKTLIFRVKTRFFFRLEPWFMLRVEAAHMSKKGLKMTPKPPFLVLFTPILAILTPFLPPPQKPPKRPFLAPFGQNRQKQPKPHILAFSSKTPKKAKKAFLGVFDESAKKCGFGCF